MSIEISNRLFDGPHRIKEWNPLNFPAIYAIMTKPDPENNPDGFQIIYLCESSELSKEKSYPDHPQYECWLKKAKFRGNIYISAHVMPNSSSEEREKLKNALISVHIPPCNEE
ncbi:hypothetical protein [Methanobacterium sp. ACI-7]|uniref:hypothetical protein n=1 Tax=unclassified Methanobacterium TaxID=2627676 RepID=UPI0039C2D64F